MQDFDIDGRHGELTGAILSEGGLLAVTADGHLLRVDARIGVCSVGDARRTQVLVQARR